MLDDRTDRGAPRGDRRGTLARSQRAVERSRRAWHFRVHLSAAKRREAELLLSQRKYYELSEEYYRQVAGSDVRTQIMRSEVRAGLATHFAELSNRNLIPQAGARLLDVGCGDGANDVAFAAMGYNVTGVDISRSAIDAAREAARVAGTTVEFVVSDAIGLPVFADDHFDLAVDIGCFHMLILSSDRESHLRAVRRVLRPGGTFLLYEQLADKDVVLDDEMAYVLRNVSFRHRRFISRSAGTIAFNGYGGRAASMGQYCNELISRGFLINHSTVDKTSGGEFALIVASRPHE